MTRHDHYLLQPSDFRADDAPPMWAHFPRLHLMLGWGPGIWETIGHALLGLRHVFFPYAGAAESPSIASVMDARDRFHMYSKLRDLAPSLVIEGVGAQCVRFDFDGDGRVLPQPHRCPTKRPHAIVPDGEYVVRHAHDDGATTITLARRAKELKPEYREKLASLGLAYAPGVGKRDAKPDGRRTPVEQAFVEHVARMKASFVEKRTKALFKEPSLRPADFDERRAAHARSRMGEIERRKRDAAGKPKRPYAEDDLIRYTCGEIARLEARDMMFDYREVPVAQLSPAGFRTFA